MMTLKNWNSLSKETKKQILSYFVDDPAQSQKYSRLLEEYHHNFDFDSYGARLKNVLNDCYLRPSDGKIVISIETAPLFAPKKTKTAKAAKPQVKITPAPQVERTRWYIDYEDKSGDLCHIWCEADSKEEARDYLYSEYWDVGEVINIYRAK